MAEKEFTLGQKLAAELIGSAMLVYVIVSSSILAFNMLEAPLGVSVLFIGVATAAWLFALVEMFGAISGAHVNPMVTVATLVTGDIDRRTASAYIPIQFLGGLIGVALANLTFVHVTGWGIFAISEVVRPDWAYLAEFWGSFVLASVVLGCVRAGSKLVGLAVGFVVGGGIITTSSTMFVNPQVSFGRIFTAAIAGVRPLDAFFFIVASFIGGAVAGVFWSYLWPRKSARVRSNPYGPARVRPKER